MYPPNSKLARLVDAAVEPLSLADAKLFLRVENSAEDALISDMIAAARMECERINDRSFITTTWQLTLDFLPLSAGPFPGFSPSARRWGGGGSYDRVDAHDGAVFLPMPPLIGVSSLSYVDQGGVRQSLDVTPEAGNVLVSTGTPGVIHAAYGKFFPLSQPRAAAVDIVYTAGYGDDPSAVPRSVVMAIRLLVAHYHKHRTTNAEVPDAVCNLLASTAWGSYG